MKKLFSLLLIILLASVCCGCGYGLVEKPTNNNSNEEQDKNEITDNDIRKSDNRFFRICYVEENSCFCYETVIVDRETKVMYLNYGDYSGGLTVMVDADGKPLLYEGELPS